MSDEARRALVHQKLAAARLAGNGAAVARYEAELSNYAPQVVAAQVVAAQAPTEPKDPALAVQDRKMLAGLFGQTAAPAAPTPSPASQSKAPWTPPMAVKTPRPGKK